MADQKARQDERKYIYDSMGNKIYLPTSPDIEEIAAIRLQDMYSGYPSQGLTATGLAGILKEADGGNMYRQTELFEEIEEKDTRIFACLQTRKQSVVGLGWDIIPADEEDKTAVMQAEFVQDVIEKIANFQEAQLDLLDAIGKGYSVSEVIWNVLDGKNVVSDLKWRHQKRFVFNDTQTELRLLTDNEPSLGESLGDYPAKFIVHKYKARSGYPARAGLLRTLAWFYLFKSYNIKDWIRFCEVYGMPLRLGKYDPSATPADRAALRTAVQSIGSDGAGIISKSTEITFESALNGSANGDIYKSFIDLINNEISIVVLGQNLTTDVQEGSRAAATVHDKVRQDLLEADCIALDKTLTQQLVIPIVIFNFGEQALYPRYKTSFEPPEDLLNDIQIDKALAVEVGLPIANTYFYNRYHISEPGPDDELVSPPGGGQFGQGGTGIPMKQTALSGDIVMGNIIPPGARKFSTRQQGVEDLVARALKEYGKLYPGIEGRLTEIVMSAKTPEQIRDRIYLAFNDIASDDLERLAAGSILLADLYGRSTVAGVKAGSKKTGKTRGR